MHSAGLLRWLALAVVAFLPLVSALGQVPFPDQDPFYYPPKGWQNKAPGTVLRSRKIQAASVGLLKFDINAWQMLYRTSGVTKDQPLHTVTTVLVPTNAKHDHVVTISSPENANYIRCAPSYAFRYSGVLEITNFEPRWEQMIYTLYLDEGWIVNAPDHEGPESAFSAGRLGGHMVLDSMRAVINYEPLQVPKNAMMIGHGYSGGSIPNGWAASLRPVYAPELNVVGWSLGGTASDPMMTLQFLDGTATSSLVLSGAVGLITAYTDELYDLFQNEIWTDAGKQAVQVTKNACVYEMVVRFFDQRIQTPKYIKGGRNISDFPQVVEVTNRNTMGRYPQYTPRDPVFMFHAAYDEEIVWYQANTTAVQWCENGANIRFLTYTSHDLNHVATYLLNVPYIIQYMRDRFAHKPYYGGGCQFDVQAQDPAFDVNVLGERYVEALQAISALLGAEIGPKDSIYLSKLREGKNPNKDGLVDIKGLHSTNITAGQGGNNSKKSKAASSKYKAMQKTGKADQASDDASF